MEERKTLKKQIIFLTALIISVGLFLLATETATATTKTDATKTTEAKTVAANSNNLPSSYDLRDLGRVSSVKSQEESSLCWSFATCAAVESSLIVNGYADENIDLSEAQLAYSTYYGANKLVTSRYAGADHYKTELSSEDFLENSANIDQAISTIARGFGLVSESKLPFSMDLTSQKLSLVTQSEYTVRDTYNMEAPVAITGKLNHSAVKAIKKGLQKYGACIASIYIDDKCFSDNYLSYYNPNGVNGFVNHSVVIVGWDDNYSASKFTGAKSKPAGDGAWLIKNSWGQKYKGRVVGDEGYQWVSYYDASVSSLIFVDAAIAEDGGSDGGIYQYDGCGYGDIQYSDTLKASGANSFTARKDILINTVNTWTPMDNSKVNIKIYLNGKKNSPTSGYLAYNKMYSTACSGYHSYQLDRALGVPKGMRFTIVITTSFTDNGNKGYYLPFETKLAYFSTVSFAQVSKGESYIYNDGKWKDTATNGKLSSEMKVYNALAKARTKVAGTKKQKLDVESSVTLKKGKSYKLKIKKSVGGGKLLFTSSNTSIAKVSTGGTIKALKKGTVKITVQAAPTAKYKTAKKIIKIIVK